MKPGRLLVAAEIAVLVLTALFLFQALGEEYSHGSPVRRHILEKGSGETGVINLVTSIYLGYRAFDTLGETVVLIISVSGVLFMLATAERRK